MVNAYARLINQYEFKNQIVFSATFAEKGEDDQVLDKNELYNNLKNNPN